MWILRRLFLCILLVECAGGATAKQPASKSVSSRPNVVLITLDTTRADRMGFMGSDRGLTPNLDTFSKDAVIFTRAYAQVPLTTPSHAALLTGTYPQFNHISDLGAPLAKDIPYLPDLLHRRGYHTAAFVGAYILDPRIEARGFDRGFDLYDAKFHRRAPGEDRYKSVERRAGAVVDSALGWLNRRPPGPFFTWLHFYDAHDPYDPPPPYKEKYTSAPYDGEIAYTDSQVGRFLTQLRDKGLYRNTIIIVAADHGEAFGEHGEERHGMFLYDETVHVPLLIKFAVPGLSGTRDDKRVGLADVAPTVLQAIGISIPKTMQAKPLERAGGISAVLSSADEAVYSETDYPHRAFGWAELRSWRTGKYVYVQAPKRELYDQTADPAELHNLAADATAVADTLQSQLSSFYNKTATAKGAQSKLDPAQAENLRALGYLASDAPATSDSGKDEIDPKDHIAIANVMHEALVDIEEDHYDDAIPKFQKVIAEMPEATNALLELGRAYIHTREYDKAVPILHTAVEKMPDSGMAHYELGLALVKTGQWEASLPEFQTAVAKTPDSAQLHFYVAAVLGRLKRVPEATQEFETTLRLDPDNYLGNLIFGRLLFLEGKPQQALPRLLLAAKLHPEFREPHRFLADLYAATGQRQKAQHEFEIAQRSQSGETP